MNIAIDGYEANVPQRLGSSQVAFELLKNLETVDHKNEYIILLPSEPASDLPRERPKWHYKILKPKRLWTKIALPLYLYLQKDRPDLFFSPTHYIPRFSPVKKVVTIFDLGYLHYPQFYKKSDLWQLTNWSKQSIEKSSAIITISNSTKKDILINYKVNKEKIHVAYPGYDKKFKVENVKLKVEDVKKRYKVENNYIIYVGTIQPRKNLIRLMEAVSRIDNLQLVAVGKAAGLGRQGWMYQDILETPKKLGIQERVRFLGFVPTEDLPFLLTGAQAFVLPSLWEGFGIPVVEAMACGTPVIVSNTSSLPEVVGEAGLIVDPFSVDQIEQAIRTIISDNKLRAKLSKLGLIQADKFSWKKMAKTVLKVFEEVGKTDR